MRRQLGWGSRFVVLYAGAHGRANAVRQLVDAAECLRDRPDILIACVGDGTERESLEALARDRRLENIVFPGPQPKDRMPLFVNGANAGAAVLQNNPTFRTVYPNKVFDYMACRRPTLLAIDGVARRMVCEKKLGQAFSPNPRTVPPSQARFDISPTTQFCAQRWARADMNGWWQMSAVERSPCVISNSWPDSFPADWMAEPIHFARGRPNFLAAVPLIRALARTHFAPRML